MKRNEFDKQFQGKSLSDLNALKASVTARLSEFVANGNAEQAFTYKRIQEALERAIVTHK